MTLTTAIETLPPPDTLDELKRLQSALEERTLRSALDASGWRPGVAARLLGRKGGSALERALGRHPDLTAEIERRRSPVRRP